jgi:transcriptional regulator with XRE-family HTH domain
MKLLRQQRLAQGWSQQDLGNRVGCTKQHISDLERGRVLPSLSLLHRLAEAVNVSDADLLLDSIADVAVRARHTRPRTQGQ